MKNEHSWKKLFWTDHRMLIKGLLVTFSKQVAIWGLSSRWIIYIITTLSVFIISMEEKVPLSLASECSDLLCFDGRRERYRVHESTTTVYLHINFQKPLPQMLSNQPKSLIVTFHLPPATAICKGWTLVHWQHLALSHLVTNWAPGATPPFYLSPYRLMHPHPST